MGGGIVELIEDYGGDAYRALYTVRFEGAVYVLHAFKKKSKRGVSTPQSEIELIKHRLKRLAAEHLGPTVPEKKT